MPLDAARIRELLIPVGSRLDELGVCRLRVFGSVARGEASDTSDVDVVVTFREGSDRYDALLDLGELLERILGRRVDLITEESLRDRESLRRRIDSEAQDVHRAA